MSKVSQSIIVMIKVIRTVGRVYTSTHIFDLLLKEKLENMNIFYLFYGISDV